MAKDGRVYLVKQMVNTLLASSLANKSNKLFKLTPQQELRMLEAVENSNRFSDEEKEGLVKLVKLCQENPRKLHQVSITWGPEATAEHAIKAYIELVSTEPKGKPLDFEDSNWKDL